MRGRGELYSIIGWKSPGVVDNKDPDKLRLTHNNTSLLKSRKESEISRDLYSFSSNRVCSAMATVSYSACHDKSEWESVIIKKKIRSCMKWLLCRNKWWSCDQYRLPRIFIKNIESTKYYNYILHPLSVFFFNHHILLLSNSTRERRYPQLPSGQAVVTGVFPSPPPWYGPSFSSRIGYSTPTFQLFMLVDFHRLALSGFPLLRSSIYFARKRSYAHTSMQS